jgi:hypothetical protein
MEFFHVDVFIIYFINTCGKINSSTGLRMKWFDATAYRKSAIEFTAQNMSLSLNTEYF